MLTKVCTVKAMVFPVVMYGCEIWTIKKAEHLRIDAFELWCWRRLLRIPWIAWRSNQIKPKGNQSWIFIGRTDAGHLMWRTDSFEKTLMLGTTEGGSRRGWQRRRKLNGITDSMDMNLSNLWKTVKDGEAWHAAVHGIARSWTWLSIWTTTIIVELSVYRFRSFIICLIYFGALLLSIYICIIILYLEDLLFLSNIEHFPGGGNGNPV